MIALEHPATPAPLFTLYAHLERALVRVGQAVGAGEPIGTVGDTAGERGERDAHTRAPHLHFELLTRWPPSAPDADRIDPTPHHGLEAGEVSPWPARKRAAAGGALVLLFLAWALSRRAQRKAPSAVARTRRPVPLQRYSEGTA
jgi:murein DD-endopeptidase MepM/ murein hydrolase activator NlpD